MTAAEPRKGVLITRPVADAGPLAEAVRSRGLDPVIAPLLEIVGTDAEVPLDGVQAVLLTSANGARALARATQRRDLRIVAVGDATAGAALIAGFGNVASADGDVDSLAALVQESCDPAAGALVHVSGRDVAGDLAGVLGAAGFTVRRAVLYHAETADSLPGTARAALAAGTVGAALFFSPRTAQSFVSLAGQAGVADDCRAVTAICLSGAVADAAAGVDWAETRIAARPDLDALLTCLDKWVSDQKPENRVTETPKDDSTPGTETAAAGPAAGSAPRRDGGTASVPPSGGASASASEAKAGPGTAGGTPAPRTAPSASRDASRGASAAWALTGLMGVLVVAAAAYIAWPLWRDHVPGWARGGLAPVMEAGRSGSGGGVPAARVAALESRIQAAQDAIAGLKTHPPQAGSSAPDMARRAALTNEIERLAAEIEGLRASVKPLEERLAALEQAGTAGGTGDLAARIEALERRAETIARQQAGGDMVTGEAVASIRAESEKRVAALESENRALSDAVAKLGQRLDQLASQSQARSGAAAGAALIAAAGELRAAAESGRSYARALESLRALAPQDPALAAALDGLGKHAEKGVATREALRRQFDATAAAIAQAASAPEGSGWVDQTVARLSKLVTVRRTGEKAAQEDSVDGHLARAELLLSSGDLQGAVAALERLSGAPAEAASGWLAAAKARLEVEQALHAVNADAIRRLGGGARDAAGG